MEGGISRAWKYFELLLSISLSPHLLNMSSAFRKLPKAALEKPRDFTVSIPKEKIVELRQLLQLSRIAPVTYEGSHENRQWGITTKWLKEAKEKWMSFDW